VARSGPLFTSLAGEIPITTLHKSVPQDFGDVKVFWNRAAIEPLVTS
jgi:hypothetical protein